MTARPVVLLVRPPELINRRNEFAQSPREGGMVLSDVLRAVRLMGAIFFDVEARARLGRNDSGICLDRRRRYA